jgi:hypothetical protein
MSERADPTPPAIPPTTGPNIRALTKIMMSPKFMYPPVAGTGICIMKVATATRADITADTATIKMIRVWFEAGSILVIPVILLISMARISIILTILYLY